MKPVSSSTPPCLTRQTALITGAGGGIGRAIALAMAAAGARVIVNDLPARHAAGEATVASIVAAGGEARFIAADVSEEAAVLAMFQAAAPVHILVNNAGIETAAPVEDLTMTEWRRVVDVNLNGAFLCGREAVRAFKRQGVDPTLSCHAGKILFISSIHESVARLNHAAYCAAKAGTMMLMRSLALEVGPEGVRVNGISPGIIRSQMTAAVTEDATYHAAMATSIPLQRIGEPEDVARLAVWLASDQAAYIHGASVVIDGGMSLQINARRFPGALRDQLAVALKRRLRMAK